MKEVLRDIKGYENIYKVSNYGRVYSIKRKKFLKLRKTQRGYIKVDLHKNGNAKTYRVHRLVAEAFIPNPNNYPEVNHKDENKENNHVNNLEWCTKEYNLSYGTRIERLGYKRKSCKRKDIKDIGSPKEIICTTTNETFICIRRAEEKYKISHSHISACCKGKRKSAGKHPITGEKMIWEYVDKKRDL